MRIISGVFKGKKIFSPNDRFTRPLRDLVKESIFNLIEHSNKFNCKIEDSNILDLFSGTGSFGLECISRNAKNVTFIENHKEAIVVLKKNILSLNLRNNYKIIEQNCFDYLNNIERNSKKYDLIFFDPPFKEKKINEMIEIIKEKKVLNKNGVILIHRHKKDDVIISKKLSILDQRSYGISKIIFGN
jgi:16S rRNA (guanine966-N2)-methyltransferase